MKDEISPNKSLQLTFDPPPILAIAKTGVASNVAELGRYVSLEISLEVFK